MPDAQVSTLKELFTHSDWARDKLMALVRNLSDEQLDQPRAMGPGSLRETLRHLYGAERVWFERWQGTQRPEFPRARDISAMDELWQAFARLAAARNHYLDNRGPEDLERPISYTDPNGRSCATRLGGLMLHVCNHGVHHRAQALNMLRRLGLKPPGLDYLFRKIERPTVEFEPAAAARLRENGFDVGSAVEPPAEIDPHVVRRYFRYADWARAQVDAIAETLSDEQLDHPFEIGLGTLRKTLLHIHDGEQWWFESWTTGPGPEFRELPQSTPVVELQGLFQTVAERRNAYLEGLQTADMQRIVSAYAQADLRLSFRLGETMLQLCGHGTHHRAQALNMLRQLDAEVPVLDYVDWLSETHQ